MFKKLRVPLALTIISYGIGLVCWAFSSQVLGHMQSDVIKLSIDKAPAGVLGSDLIANLLTISALVVSGCFVYICLPSDRLELRISTHVRDSFIDQLRDESVFIDYCNDTDDNDLTSGDKLIRLFLSPRIAIGGWHRMQRQIIVDNFDERFAEKLDRFVDKHADAQWLVMLTWALGLSMLWGFICLIIRFFGINQTFFSPMEFGCIITMMFLNVSTVFAANMLAFGGRSVEKRIRLKIDVCIRDSQQTLRSKSLERRNQEMDQFRAAAQEAVSATGPATTNGGQTTRPRSRQPRKPPTNGV